MRIVGLAVFLMALFIYGASQLKLAGLVEAVSTLTVTTVLITLLLCSLNILVVSSRLWRTLNHFGFPMSWTASYRASMQSNLASLFLFSLIGQAIGRQDAMLKHGVPAGLNIGLLVYERIIVTATSLLFAGIGILSYANEPSLLDFIANLHPWTLVTVVVISYFLGFVWRLGATERFFISRASSIKNLKKMLEIFGISTVSTTLMAFAYAGVFMTIAPGLVFDEAVSAALVISFLAGIPITVGGWGVREAATVYFLGLKGVSPEAALVAGIGVGVLSTIAVLILAIPTVAMSPPAQVARNPANVSPKNLNAGVGGDSSRLENAFLWIFLSAVSVLIFFQAHLFLGATNVNVNLADPLAVLFFALLVVEIFWFKKKPQWKLERLNIFILAISGVVLFGYLHGLFAGIKSQWAQAKVVGLVVLIGYLAAGMTVTSRFGNSGARKIFSVMLLTCTLIMLLEVFKVSAFARDIDELTYANVMGFAGNPNAFTFQILVALALMLGFSVRSPLRVFGGQATPIWTRGLSIFFVALAFFCMYLANSRSGIATGLILLATLGILEIWKSSRKRLPVFGLIGIVATIWISIQWSQSADGASVLIDGSAQQRREMLIGALDGWRGSPLLGTGLGWFYERSVTVYGTELTIHGSPFWLLSEFGLLGFLTFLALGYQLASFSCSETERYSRSGTSLLLVLVSAVCMGFFHEVIYQRLLWFVFGILLAERTRKKSVFRG